MSKIILTTTINATPEQCYNSYLDPQDNKRWNTAGFGWTVGFTKIDAKVGGSFAVEYKYAVGKYDFILGGVYTKLVQNRLIRYDMPQNMAEFKVNARKVEVGFEDNNVVSEKAPRQSATATPQEGNLNENLQMGNSTKVTITFDAEEMNSIERQEQGWQAILNNFKTFVERKSNPNNAALNKSVVINSSAEKVWNAIVDNENYKLWTAQFCAGSYYEGEMTYDSKIRFLSPNKSGLSSVVRVCIPNFQISFEHLGFIKDGVEDLDNPEFSGWKGARETYTLREENGKTTLEIYQEMTINEPEFFDKSWDKALAIIKQIAEQN